MKTQEIITALNLTKRKETTNFASKLASLFEFIKLVKSDIKEAAIIETDLNIADYGKVLSNSGITEQYKEQRLNTYRWNCPEIESLRKEASELGTVIYNHTYRKEKKNKNAAEIVEKATTEKTELENRINEMLKAEGNRIAGLSFTCEFIRNEMSLLKGCKILLDTTKGIYSFVVPVQNKFFYALCDLIGLIYVPESKVKPEIKKTIVIDTDILKAIHKAKEFVSKDEIRPAMTGICISFVDECNCEVVATDAHKMYYSEKIACTSIEPGFKIIIAPSAFKKIPKKASGVTIDIINNTTALFNGIDIELIDENFPNYKVVIPEYKTYMSFERKDLLQAVKYVETAANKITSKVTFHLNGNIELSAQDIDFCFENNQRVNYLYKDFQDFDIAFNSQLLKTCLNAFDETELKMYSESRSTRAVIFTNGIDNALLMPLMLNS